MAVLGKLFDGIFQAQFRDQYRLQASAFNQHVEDQVGTIAERVLGGDSSKVGVALSGVPGEPGWCLTLSGPDSIARPFTTRLIAEQGNTEESLSIDVILATY